MSKLRFGWSEVDITPKDKIALEGEFFERATNEVETPLTMTCLAIEKEGVQTYFVSTDLVGVVKNLVDDAKEKISNKEIDKDGIMVSCVHTHNSHTYTQKNAITAKTGSTLKVIQKYMPSGCKYIPQVTSGDCLSPDKALDFLSTKLATVIEKAYENLKEGYYATGFGRVAVGMNRRVCYTDGSAKMWGDANQGTFTTLEGGNDNGMELLFIFDKDKKITGIVSNIACPSQVMEQRSVISSDYWGKLKILLREKYGKDLYLLPLCAPAGDQCPRDLIRWVEPETPIKDPNIIRINPKMRDADPSMFDVKGTWKIGKRIFNEIVDVIDEGLELKDDAILIHKKENLRLPLRKVTDMERDKAEAKINEFFKGKDVIDYNDTAALHVYAGTLIRYDCQQNLDMFNAEVHYVRFGDIAFATNPFELFLDYANQIRARSEAKQTFLIQLACDCFGYLPTEKAEKGGHYSAYISSGTTGHEGGDILVRETLENIRDLFGKE